MRNPDLFNRLVNLVRRVEPGGFGQNCFTVGDFYFRWQTEAAGIPQPTVRVWEGDDGSDLGFAWMSGNDLHIVSRRDEIFTGMLDWGEAIAGTSGRGQPLNVVVRQTAGYLREELARRGYRIADPVLVLRSHMLDSIPRRQPLPHNYRLAEGDSQAMSEGWTDAYREVFAPEPMLVETRKAVERSPIYRSDLDLVALDASGAVAAFVLAWFDPETNTGTLEPVGCCPSHRRQGLSRALMIEGLDRLALLGARRAFVTTSQARLPANMLYESVGFSGVARYQTWLGPV